MEIFNDIMQFFSIGGLSYDATFLDLLNYVIQISVSIFVTCFIIRSVFMAAVLPGRFNV